MAAGAIMAAFSGIIADPLQRHCLAIPRSSGCRIKPHGSKLASTLWVKRWGFKLGALIIGEGQPWLSERNAARREKQHQNAAERLNVRPGRGWPSGGETFP
jgi:hypothetical protein